MKEIFDLLSNFGFPVVVATYLLVRLEQRMKAMEDAENVLSSKIEALIDKVEDACRR